MLKREGERRWEEDIEEEGRKKERGGEEGKNMSEEDRTM